MKEIKLNQITQLIKMSPNNIEQWRNLRTNILHASGYPKNWIKITVHLGIFAITVANIVKDIWSHEKNVTRYDKLNPIQCHTKMVFEAGSDIIRSETNLTEDYYNQAIKVIEQLLHDLLSNYFCC